MPPHERKRRRRRIVLVSGLVLALFVSAAAAYVVTRKPGDVSNPDVEFRAEPSATPEQEVEPDAPGKKKTDPFDRFIWPIYGYTRDRRRYLPLKDPPHPPFDEVWRFSGNVLLEFPPVIGGKRLYLLNDHGKLFCIDKRTGEVRWRRKLGALAAASPAYADGKVYVVLLQRAETGGGAKAGRVVALDGKSGKVEWSNKLASRSESSPLVADGRLFSCDEDGDVAIFHLSADPAKAGILTKPEPLENDFYQTVNPFLEINMQSCIYCNAVAANGVLYIATREHLFAIETKKP